MYIKCVSPYIASNATANFINITYRAVSRKKHGISSSLHRPQPQHALGAEHCGVTGGDNRHVQSTAVDCTIMDHSQDCAIMGCAFMDQGALLPDS